MDSMKNTVLSLAVLALLLGCVALGKYLFMPDTAIDAQAPAAQQDDGGKEPQIGRYQVSCTSAKADNGDPVCVIIDTVGGRVVNVIKPRADKWCGMNAKKDGTIDCDDTLNKSPNKKGGAGSNNKAGAGAQSNAGAKKGDGSGGGKNHQDATKNQ